MVQFYAGQLLWAALLRDAVIIFGFVHKRQTSAVWNGDFLGTFSDPEGAGISGSVYAVNRTCLQILNFTYNSAASDLFFVVDTSPSGPTANGFTLSTFEYGDSPLGNYKDARMILVLPDDKSVQSYRSMGLWSKAFRKSFGFVSIPTSLEPPKSQFLEGTLEGNRYSVGSGPILVLDRRTIKIYGFTYDGPKAPDGYFFVGKGRVPKRSNGAKVPIRGRDTPEFITAISELYTGDKDLILDLPEGYDVSNIDYISVYCYRFAIDFGHVKVSQNLSDRIPPHIPVQKRYDQIIEEKLQKPWDPVILLGHEGRTNFTFQLGPPGGKRGYEAIAAAKPANLVWYVNGFLAPEMWLLRSKTYHFIIEGGSERSTHDTVSSNPLYISNEEIGGISKFSPDEKEQVVIYAGLDTEQKQPLPQSDGRLCVWSHRVDHIDADAYDDFAQYRKMLKLNCEPGEPGGISWTPDASTPDTVYYQSYANFHMGGKIVVVDDIPQDLPDVKEEPFEYDDYSRQEQQQQKKTRQQNGQEHEPLLRHSQVTSAANYKRAAVALQLLLLVALSLFFSAYDTYFV